MNRAKTVVGAFLAVSAVVVGCSSTDASEKYPTADAFCSAKAAEECGKAPDGIAAVCGASVDACTTKRKAVCTTFTGAASSRKYTASFVQACIDKTKEVFAKRVISPDDTKAVDDTCSRVFQGSIAKGAACKTDFECSGSLVCDKDTCDTKVVKNLTEGCANTGETCAKGAYCTVDGQTRRCLAKKAKGDACNLTAGTTFAPCTEELRCAAGSCGDRVSANEACLSNDDCGSTAPYCDVSALKTTPPGTPKCISGITFGAGGTFCKDFGAN